MTTKPPRTHLDGLARELADLSNALYHLSINGTNHTDIFAAMSKQLHIMSDKLKNIA